MDFAKALLVIRLRDQPRTNRGPAFAETSYLLECMSDLQHTEIVTVAADDLDADRQPSSVNPAGTEIAGQKVT